MLNPDDERTSAIVGGFIGGMVSGGGNVGVFFRAVFDKIIIRYTDQ